jgi:hypothetical protein
LNFVTTVTNRQTLPSNLTERRFRSYWERTSAGELLAQIKVRGEQRDRANKQNLKYQRKSTPATSVEPLKLSDLGVTKQQSSRWQKFAAPSSTKSWPSPGG